MSLYSIKRVHLEHSPYQVSWLLGDVIRQGILSCSDLFEEDRQVFWFKGKFSSKHRKKDNTTAPHIGSRTLIVKPLNDFRRCIVWRSTRCHQALSIHHSIWETKIGYLQLFAIIDKEDIFGLKVSVRYPLRMHIDHGFNKLTEVFARFLFGQLFNL